MASQQGMSYSEPSEDLPQEFIPDPYKEGATSKEGKKPLAFKADRKPDMKFCADGYSTDDEDHKVSSKRQAFMDMVRNSKFMTRTRINDYEVEPWEILYFFGVRFKPHQSSIVEHIAVSLHHLYPDGVPSWYTQQLSKELGSSDTVAANTPWKKVASEMSASFFEQYPDMKWMESNFDFDHWDIVISRRQVAEDIRDQDELIDQGVKRDIPAAKLASKFHEFLLYITDEKWSDEPKPIKEKRDKIKGMVEQILGYMKLSYRCKANLDHIIPFINGFMRMITRPDFTLYADAIPYAVIQVYNEDSDDYCNPDDPCDMEVVDEKDHNQSSKPPLDETEMIKEDLDRQQTQNHDIQEADHSQSKRPKFYGTGMAGIVVHDDHSEDHSDHCKMIKAVTAESMKNLKEATPEECKEGRPFDCLSGQLLSEMMGLLVEKEKLICSTSPESIHRRPENSNCAGMFVMNDTIYLATLSHCTKHLYRVANKESNVIPERKGISTLRRTGFDLKVPSSRLGFLVFLHYLHQIKKAEPHFV